MKLDIMKLLSRDPGPANHTNRDPGPPNHEAG